MKFFVGVTDKNWFHSLPNINTDEVKFSSLGVKRFPAIEIEAPSLVYIVKELYKLLNIIYNRPILVNNRWNNENVYRG